MVLTNTFGELSAGALESFESRTGLVLPDSYGDFLLAFNGGQPIPNEADVPNQQPVIVDLLYGICDTRIPGDLQYEMSRRGDLHSKGFIPIGHDPGGNTFLLGLFGTQAGRVFYWDSCLFFDGSDEQHNTYPLATSIGELLSSLH